MDCGDILDIEIDLGLDEDVEMSDDELKKELELLNKEEEEKVNELPNKEEKKVNVEHFKNTEIKQTYKQEETTNEKIKQSKYSTSKNTVDSESLKLEEEYEKKSDYFKKAEIVRNQDMFKNGLIDSKRLNKYLDVSKDTDPLVVGREIAYRLQEPKAKLFGSAVRVLGVELCLEIFNETKKIVKQGGLKTDKGERKRSPGGTFLYIMKNRGYASPTQMKEIFKFEEYARKKAKQQRYKSKRITSKHANSDNGGSKKT